jgi:hypothetical protein
MRRVDISTGTDPGVTFAQHILHPRRPNAKSLSTAVLTSPSKVRRPLGRISILMER